MAYVEVVKGLLAPSHALYYGLTTPKVCTKLSEGIPSDGRLGKDSFRWHTNVIVWTRLSPSYVERIWGVRRTETVCFSLGITGRDSVGRDELGATN